MNSVFLFLCMYYLHLVLFVTSKHTVCRLSRNRAHKNSVDPKLCNYHTILNGNGSVVIFGHQSVIIRQMSNLDRIHMSCAVLPFKLHYFKIYFCYGKYSYVSCFTVHPFSSILFDLLICVQAQNICNLVFDKSSKIWLVASCFLFFSLNT